MPRRLIAVLILTVTVLLVGAGSLYAFDRQARHRIADGVTVNGVDVGGLTPAQARVKLSNALLKPLDRPVSVRYHGERFTLTPRAAKIAIDIDGSVDRAMEASQKGNLFTRTWREVRGTELDARVEAKISWDRAGVRKVVRRVKAKLTVPPRDASVDLSSGHVDPITSKDGRSVELDRLRHDIKDRFDRAIVVNRGAFSLTLYKDLKPAKTYPIAVGRIGLETPAGLYHIQNKAVNPAWNVPKRSWAGDLAGRVIPGGAPDNPLKARWLGIFDGAGIHGTDAIGSIGTAASHGCIRMRIPDVIELYDEVNIGAPVYIA